MLNPVRSGVLTYAAFDNPLTISQSCLPWTSVRMRCRLRDSADRCVGALAAGAGRGVHCFGEQYQLPGRLLAPPGARAGDRHRRPAARSRRFHLHRRRPAVSGRQLALAGHLLSALPGRRVGAGARRRCALRFRDAAVAGRDVPACLRIVAGRAGHRHRRVSGLVGRADDSAANVFVAAVRHDVRRAGAPASAGPPCCWSRRS